MERYRILYIYKILTGQVQNCGIDWSNTQNSGTTISEISTHKYFQTQRENSFHYAAPRLFNRLPRSLRDDRTSTIDEWKMKLDDILSKIPDEPAVSDLTPGLCDHNTSKPTNSLYFWLTHLDLNTRR